MSVKVTSTPFFFNCDPSDISNVIAFPLNASSRAPLTEALPPVPDGVRMRPRLVQLPDYPLHYEVTPELSSLSAAANENNLEKALRCASLGLPVFPVREVASETITDDGEVIEHKRKAPYTPNGFYNATTNESIIRRWWKLHPDALVGLRTGSKSGVVALDVDVKDGKDGRAVLDRHCNGLIERLNREVYGWQTPSGGMHFLFKHPKDLGSPTNLLATIAGMKQTGLDVRGEGGSIIVYGEPVDARLLAEWPPELQDAIERDQRARDALREAGSSTSNGKWKEAPDDAERAADALTYIPADDRWTWVQMGMALKSAFGDAGRSIWDEWSRTCADKFKDRDQATTWRSFKDVPGGVGLGTLFHIAQECGYRHPRREWKPNGHGRTHDGGSGSGGGGGNGGGGSGGGYGGGGFGGGFGGGDTDDGGGGGVGGDSGTQRGKKGRTEKKDQKNPPPPKDKDDDETQVETLLRFIEKSCLFRAPDGKTFAGIMVNGHNETWAIKSAGFKRWLLKRYMVKRKTAPQPAALASALNMADALAFTGEREYAVHVRVAERGGKVYLDLCDRDWRCVEIDADGWRIITSPPVHFRRFDGMLPLPVPCGGGSIEDLKPFVNVKDRDFELLVSWALQALQPRGAYPLLSLIGLEGSAKTTTSKNIRNLIDPNEVDERSLPKDAHDLFITATRLHALAYENVSKLPDWLSDVLCRISDGGGHADRSLYTDDDEHLFKAKKPVIITSIDGVIKRADLTDRTVKINVQPIVEGRKTKEEMEAAFEEARPLLLGALLDGVVTGLARSKVMVPDLPRMADFAQWATRCETAYWPEGTFMTAYRANIAAAVEGVIYDDPVGCALAQWMKRRDSWEGTPTELLKALDGKVEERAKYHKSWPANAQSLSRRINALTGSFGKCGIIITMTRGDNKQIKIVNKTRMQERKEEEDRIAEMMAKYDPDAEF